MNLTGQGVYPRGVKRKRVERAAPAMTTLESFIGKAKAKGTERQFLDWLKTQPSALGTGYDYDWDLGQVSTPAHWRTAKHAGMATKPEYLAIPLRDAEHKLAHQKGDSTVGTREWWEAEVVKHLHRWLAS